MKLKQILESKQSLERLIQCPLPLNIAWNLKKIIKFLNPELVSYEEMREQKIKEMGEEVESEMGTQFTVKKELLPDFLKWLEELQDKEIDVVVPQIKIDELLQHKDINGKYISILQSDLEQLDWLIVE